MLIKSFSVKNVNESKALGELPFYPETVEYTKPKGHAISPQETVMDLGHWSVC